MKKCFVILGMHRSGTSALMGVLKALSVELGSGGSGFIEAGSDNVKGYFELIDIVTLNDRILGSLHSSWDNCFSFQEDWWKQPEFKVFKEEISAVIDRNFDGVDTVCIKDPRLCRLLPIWTEALDEQGIETSFIIPLRNPMEIAGSLRNRDGFSLEKSLLLWMAYMLDAESYSRKYPRVFTTYNGLLRDTPKTIAAVSNTLKFNFPKDYPEVKADISAFLETGLKHCNNDSFPTDGILYEEIFRLYKLLLEFENKDIGQDKYPEIDRIKERYSGLRNLFYNRDIVERESIYASRENDANRKIVEATAEKEKAIAERSQAILEKNFALFEKEKAVKRMEGYESRFIYIPWLRRLEQKLRKKVMSPIKNKFIKV